MIIDGKTKYNINREAAKILALLSGELINMSILQVKKYLTVQAKFTHSTFGKAFEK